MDKDIRSVSLSLDIETKDDFEKAETSEADSVFMRNALAFMKTSDSKWCDARGQSGPSPADFGDHEPIPLESICASVVISSNEDN